MEMHELISSFNEGKPRAFKKIYDMLYLRVFNYAKSLVIEYETAQDITASVFVKLWVSRGNFENIDKLTVFILVITKNACYDHINLEKRNLKRKEEFIYLTQQRNDITIDPLIELAEIKADVIEQIHEEIEKLPLQCKTIFTLSYLNGKENHEIAEMLKISDKTVRNQKVLALKFLRKALSELYFLLVIFDIILRLYIGRPGQI